MSSSVLPLFQYPTTTVWVDDDALFLQTIDASFQGNKKIFTLPGDCDSFFNTPHLFSKITFLHGEYGNENYHSLEHAPVDFDVTEIAKLCDQPERFQEVSVLVCDHNMPEMTGLELCSKLQKFPVKKFLLTGNMQNVEAVKAFNDRLIDKFIHKYDPSLFSEIPKHIKILERQYFCEITRPLLLHLEVDHVLPLSDAAFVSFFNQWCEDNKIYEFYLIDKWGSFLTIDLQNEIRYFVIHTERSLDDFVKFYSNNAEVEALIRCVIDRNKIPFFGYKKDAWQVSHSEWNKYFYTPYVFNGRERYYWTVL